MQTTRHNTKFAAQRGSWPRCGDGLSAAPQCALVVLCLALLGIAQLVGAAAAGAQDDGFIDREYPLKALFLYNFGGYVEWPPGTFAEAASPFCIGMYGAAPLDATLNQIAAQKAVGRRRIIIERFKTIDDVKPVQILFISRAVPRQQQLQLLQKVKGKPVLTVGESPQFAHDGGCVNFFIQANRIRFEINVDAVKQQGLKVNSKLLAMAKIIGEQPSSR